MKSRSGFIAALLLCPLCVRAQTVISWNSLTTGNWSDSTKWLADAGPATGYEVTYQGLANGTSVVDETVAIAGLEANFLVRGPLTITSTGGNFISLQSGASIFQGSAFALNLFVPIEGAGSLSVDSAGVVTLNPGAGSNTYTGSTEVTSGGTLVDGEANSYSAASVMSIGGTGGGTLDVNFNEAIAGLNDVVGGAGSVVLAGGTTLTLTGAFSTTFSGVISGGGSLVMNGPSTQILEGANTYTGPTVINSGGALNIGGGTATGSIVSNVSGSGGISFDLSNAYTYAGTLSGALDVVQQGTGVTTLSGPNTYTGVTTINAGTLRAGSSSAFGNPTQTVSINGSGTLDLNGFSYTLDSVQSFSAASAIALNGGAALTLSDASAGTTFAGIITGTGALNTSNLSLNLTGNGSTYSGGTTISAGTLIANNSNSLDSATGTGPITIMPGAALLFGQANTNGYVNSGTLITDNGAVQFFRTDVTANVIANNITGTGSVSQNGTGITLLSGVNTYSGATNVFQGTLEAGSANAFGSLSQINFTDDGTLSLNGFSTTVGSIVGTPVSGGINLAGGTLTIANSVTDPIFSGTISGTGNLTIGGSSTAVILTGSNTYTGATNIAAGTLLVANPSGNGTGTGTINIGPSATLQIGANSTAGAVNPASNISDNGTLAFSLTNSSTIQNQVSGTGGVTLLASGTITFTNANTYSGPTLVEVGTLVADNPSGLATGTGAIAVSLGATLQIGNHDSAGSLDASTIIDSNGTVIFTRNDSPTFANFIAGSGGVTMNGAGAVTLSGTNIYTGPTNITSGELVAGSTSAFGGITGRSAVTLTTGGELVLEPGFSNQVGSISGDTTGIIDLIGANLALDGVGGTTFAGTVTGTGGLMLFGSGTTVLDGANTYTGVTTIASGTLQIGDGVTPGASIVSSVVDEGTLVFEPFTSDNITYPGSITGTGGVTLAGGGVITFSGTGSSYSGPTSINSGTLADATGGAFSPNSSVNISAGGTLAVNHNETVADLENGTGAGPVTLASGATLTIGTGNSELTPFNGALSGPGSLVINTNLGLSLSQGLSGANNYSGGTTVQNGELFVGSNTAVGTGTLTFDAGTELSPSANVTLANPIILSGGESLDNDDGGLNNLTLTGLISEVGGQGSITWCTPGTLALTNANAFTGGIDMREGTLLLGNDSAAGIGGTITLDSGTILAAYGGPGVTRTLANDISLNGSSTQFGNLDNNNLVLNGTITGEASITYNGGTTGTLTLNGASNGFSGPFTISSGTVIAGNNNSFGSSGNSVSLTGGAGLDVQSGTTINNPLSFTGAPNTLGGSGMIGSAVTVDSHLVLAPTSATNGPGVLSFNGGLTFATGGAISFDIYDAAGAQGTGYSFINANSGLNITASAGSLTFNIFSTDINGNPAAAINFNPAVGHSWNFLLASPSITGFSANEFNINSSGFLNGGGGTFGITGSTNDLTLNFTPVPEPSTWAMVGAGLLALVPFALRRRLISKA